MQDNPERFCKEWSFPSDWGKEKQVLSELKEMARAYRVPDDRIEDMASAVAEACLNAAEHGNFMTPERFVKVVMRMNGGDIGFRVYDEGDGPQQTDPTIRNGNVLDGNARGWGITLMSRLADELRFDRDETGFYTELLFRACGGAMNDE